MKMHEKKLMSKFILAKLAKACFCHIS